MNRRQFLKLSGLAGAGLFLHSCEKYLNPNSEDELVVPPPDIAFSTDLTATAGTLRNNWSLVQSTARGKAIRIGAGSETLLVALISVPAISDAPVLKLTKEQDGSSVYLSWGSKQLSPSIKFTDQSGNLLLNNGQEMEYGFRDLGTSLPDTSGSWLEKGLILISAGLAVWLGAKIFAAILGGIAFLAWGVFVVGLILAGGSLLISFIHWILSITGWQISDAEALFHAFVNSIAELISKTLEIASKIFGM